MLDAEGRFFGVLTVPAQAEEAAQRPGILLLTAGVTHRIGPNRLYVRLARQLSARGFYVLRFDRPGVGDAVAELSAPGAVIDEARVVDWAFSALARSGPSCFVLVGLCSGGDEALRLAARDDVIGAVAINATIFSGTITPSVHTQLTDEARLRFYQRRLLAWSTVEKVLRLRFDVKAVSGTLLRVALHRSGKAWRRVSELALSPGQTPKERRNWQPPSRCEILLAASEGSHAWSTLPSPSSRAVELRRYPNTDHTFSQRETQDTLIGDVCNWIGERFATATAAPFTPEQRREIA